MSNLSADDLVFYEEGGNIMSGGYLIDSILMKQGISPMTTLNQRGGLNNNGEHVSNIFENLAVPAGLLYTYKKGGSINKYQPKKSYTNGDIALSDAIHDDLFKQIEIDLYKKNTNKNTKKKYNKNLKKSNKYSKKQYKK
jgi:hypothetical protein